MKRFMSVAAALLFAAISIQAQKIDARLTALLPSNNKVMSNGAAEVQQTDTAAVKQDINVSFNKDCSVRSFSAFAMVKEGYSCPTAELQQLGIEIKNEIGNMLILNVPAESLLALGEMEEIESVSADQMNHIMNNVAREKSKVTEVATLEKAQSHGLPQAYTGKGVMVGIIDTGMDFNHAAFRYADGTSRVKMALMSNGNSLSQYTDPNDIAALKSDDIDRSHGTHVAGTAAGSIIDGLNRNGIATEAELMLCGLRDDLYESTMIDAIKKMFEFAKQQGKPCVINLSIGNVGHFHDGISSGVLQGLREYYKTEEDKKGRIVVFSAGNSGGHQAAIYTTLPAAGTDGYNLRTVLGETTTYDYYNDVDKKFVTVNRYKGINNFFYNQDGSDMDVDVKVVDVTTGQVYSLSQKPLYTSQGSEVTSLSKTKSVYSKNNKTYVGYSYNSTVQFHEPNLKLAFFVKSAEGKTFRAMDKREEKTEGYFSCGLAGYTDGQDNGAFNIHTCGEETIGVGSYFSARTYMNINGKNWGYADKTLVDRIAQYSSWGTDDNGVNHPDVIAPGSVICSAYNLYDGEYFDADGTIKIWTGDENKNPSNDLSDNVTLFGRNNFYGSMEGTSMAAPHTTGIIALWLQAKPDMTYADVRKLIKETSKNDDYTTNLDLIPGKNVIQAGAGKIDALKGLQKLTGTTAIKMVEADGFRQATPATMYDVDDNCYNTLGQRVSKNTKGIVIYKGKVYLNR